MIPFWTISTAGIRRLVSKQKKIVCQTNSSIQIEDEQPSLILHIEPPDTKKTKVHNAYAMSQCNSKRIQSHQHSYTSNTNQLEWFVSSWDYHTSQSFYKLLSTKECNHFRSLNTPNAFPREMYISRPAQCHIIWTHIKHWIYQLQFSIIEISTEHDHYIPLSYQKLQVLLWLTYL